MSFKSRMLQLTGLALLMAVALSATVKRSIAEEDGIYARIHTSKGDIVARLFYQRAPMTVMNFIGLADGTTAWMPEGKKNKVKTPLYKGLVFHSVKDFMIQTGDPTGTGKGGPGFMFDDEFHPELEHSKVGTLSMATRGANTNGSQFFITKKPANWLDRRNPVFGRVVKGLDVVEKINQGDKLESVEIVRFGDQAKAFDAGQAHKMAASIKEKLRQAVKKMVLEPFAELDVKKVPSSGQGVVSPGDFEFLVIGHSEMPVAPKLGRVFFYNRKGALEVASKLVRIARGKGVDFKTLIKTYSDMSRDTTSRNIEDSPYSPAGLKPIFSLRPGQISDPLDLPGGVYIFHRLQPAG